MSIDRPTLKLRPNKSPKRISYGFPWVYANELVLDRRAKKLPAGSLAKLVDADGAPLGMIAVNTASKIAGRVLDLAPDAALDAGWFAEKLRHAAALRDRIYPEPFYRLVHAEADGLPGVIIDRFGDVFSVQPNAAWADTRIEMLAEALVDVFGAKVIVKNASGRARTLEGLDEETVIMRGEISAPIPVPMNGAIYQADLIDGQKTGLFYDQRDNHRFAASLARGGDVLDVFCHIGGFGLAALAAGATSAHFVDGSASALEAVEHSGGQMDVAVTTQKADAFAAMTEMAAAGRQFDLVVCDPPAFAPAKPTLSAGLRAYEKTARMGAALVKPGGYLCLCSCSHAADLEKFRTASLRGIGRAGRQGQIIHTGAAGADHPVHPHLAESSYLKSLFLRLS